MGKNRAYKKTIKKGKKKKKGGGGCGPLLNMAIIVIPKLKIK